MITTIPIIILNWKGLDDTLECMESVLTQSYRDLIVYLVDNGSSQGDAAALQKKFGSNPQVKVVLNNRNFGFTRGNNRIMQELLTSNQDFKYIVLLNNDTVVDKEWLENLVRSAEENNADMVSSKLINYFDRSKLDNVGHIMLNTGEVLPKGSYEDPDKYPSVEDNFGACAGAALYSKRMLNEIGIFDEYFNTGYEDAELGIRAVITGYRSILEPNAVVYHKVSTSINKVRDYSYALKLQTNITYTYLKLMPATVIFVNLPFILIKYLGIAIVSILTIRTRLLKVQYQSLVQIWQQRNEIMQTRKEFMKDKQISPLEILRKQSFFLSHYLKYFRKFILKRQRTVFEK